jgi:hypothetical protein
MSRNISRYGWLHDLPDFDFRVYQSSESAQVAKIGHAALPKSGEAAIGGNALICFPQTSPAISGQSASFSEYSLKP